jgi:hypothetical protein
MARETYTSVYCRGTGSAITLQLGWIPDFVKIANGTDGDIIYEGHVMGGRNVMPFSSGGTNQIQAGDTIKGATSGATAKVLEVILNTGTFAAGTAAGWFIIDFETKVGTFASENVYEYPNPTAGGIDDATVTVDVVFGNDIDTEVAGTTGNAAVTPYAGTSAANSKGITIGSTISEASKLLAVHCWRSDTPRLCPNSA